MRIVKLKDTILTSGHNSRAMIDLPAGESRAVVYELSLGDE